jgi:AraC-like DNA-binding protein
MIISRIWAINRINLVRQVPIVRENRERWAIAIKTAGQTLYTACGHHYLSDASHVVILPAGSTYNWISREPGECIMFEFDAGHRYDTQDLISIRINSPTEISSIAQKLEHLWVFKKPAYAVKCLAGLYDIVSRLAEAELLRYEDVKKHRVIMPSVTFLETHYHEHNLNNDHLAALSGISTVYFRKIFAGIYQMSPMKYIQSIRIAKAKDMLIGDFSSIAAVAEAVGYDSIYHFCKIFKKVTGTTPTEFARTYRISRPAPGGDQAMQN